MLGKYTYLPKTSILGLFGALILCLVSLSGDASAASPTIVFPVHGAASYSNDYLAPRSHCGSSPCYHHATDIIAKKHTPIVAAVEGTITYVGYPQPSWGYMIQITSDSGWEYNYLHINNDTPGTDDGNSPMRHVYAPGMKEGDRVRAGQLLGWVGDSGNAEGTVAHLHFERYKPDGTPTNPYPALREAYHVNHPHNAAVQESETLPDGEGTQGVNVDLGNTTNDSYPETVTGLRVGGPPRVAIYNRLNSEIKAWYAYPQSFRGGVDVAVGNIINASSGEQNAEIATSPDKGRKPEVKIWRPDGVFITSFMAYDESFTGGVRVATADVDNDGVDEIVTGAGVGHSPLVRIFERDGTLIREFLAGREGFKGGIDVAGGNVTGSDIDEIITSYGPGGGTYVKVFDSQTGQTLRTSLAYSSTNMSGMRVTAGDIRNDDYEEIVVALVADNVPLVKIYDGVSGERLESIYFWEEWWRGYYDVAAESDVIKGSSGVNRRASVRPVEASRFGHW